MPRDPRHDILFKPVQIGPKTAKNRFYQVPHCNAMGYMKPQGDAAHRSMKAEGGWAVICTEACSIHPSAEAAPYAEKRLWDERDARDLALFAEASHSGGALAGIELAHWGLAFSTRSSRAIPLSPSPHVTHYNWDPVVARGMDKADIKDVRRWQAEAAKRAVDIGFDIIYVYVAHGLSIAQHFLSPVGNRRTDEYGGSVENRARLIGEMLEDTKEAVGGRAAVAIRFAVEEVTGPTGITMSEEGQAVVEMFAELPDLWDVNVADWQWDSGTARFDQEGHQEQYVSWVKQKTSKPVVGVGRFTSPDAMVSQIERGILDFIGAARPSIADPFIPKKIDEGRSDDIRECIGCNICVASEAMSGQFKCTQNPTAGEEFRRGWHPEEIDPKVSDNAVLVVGAGPAGLECARALGARGYSVHLVEAKDQCGGRVGFESTLPGLASYSRVADYRMHQIGKMKNIEIHTGTTLTAEDILDYGAEIVVLATGASWRRSGISHSNLTDIPNSERANVYTPDDFKNGIHVEGPLVVFDDDHYYMGSVIAEKLRQEGHEVLFVTPLMEVARWTENTLEQDRITEALMSQGIEILTYKNIAAIDDGEIELACVYTDKRERHPCKSVVLVTSRMPDDDLYQELAADPGRREAAGSKPLNAIGDALSPSTIQAAVHAGHLFAREFAAPIPNEVPYRLERIALAHQLP